MPPIAHGEPSWAHRSRVSRGELLPESRPSSESVDEPTEIVGVEIGIAQDASEGAASQFPV